MSTAIGFGRKSQPVRHRTIEVRVISAQDLEDVKHLSRMRTYAVVYVEQDRTARTRVDEFGGTEPVWNETVSVTFHAGLPENDALAALNVDIYARGHLHDKLVGSARILLSSVLKGEVEGVELGKFSGDPVQCVSMYLRRPSGRPKGLVNLWIPPTGKFLVPRASLSLGNPETPETPAEAGVFEEKLGKWRSELAAGDC